MAKHYELLSGEKINLNRLKKNERSHIKSLEKRISECKNHDKEDYFNVYGEANILTLGRRYTASALREVYNQGHYKIAADLATRYWFRCFSKAPKFNEYIRREGLEAKYLRYLEQDGRTATYSLEPLWEMMNKAAAKVGLYPERQNTKRQTQRNKRPKR